MDLPVIVILPDGSRRLFERPEPFSCERTLRVQRPQIEMTTAKEPREDPDTGEITIHDVDVEITTMVEVDEVDTITHPAGAWASYSEAEFEAACPGWDFLPVQHTEHDRTKVSAIPKPISEWIIHPDRAEVTYDVTELPPAVVPVPASVTNFQARAALLAAGLFDQVNDAMLAKPANSTDRQAWEYANELTRSGTLVNSMAETLGFTAAQLDDLFRTAATIEA